jgi:ATP-dependent protease ClpP protease subunit
MTKNSLMLIHQLSTTTENGKYAELQDQMANMDSLMKIIVNIYKENTNISDSDLFLLLQKDIWLNSTECLRYGLVDEII